MVCCTRTRQHRGNFADGRRADAGARRKARQVDIRAECHRLEVKGASSDGVASRARPQWLRPRARVRPPGSGFRLDGRAGRGRRPVQVRGGLWPQAGRGIDQVTVGRRIARRRVHGKRGASEEAACAAQVPFGSVPSRGGKDPFAPPVRIPGAGARAEIRAGQRFRPSEGHAYQRRRSHPELALRRLRLPGRPALRRLDHPPDGEQHPHQVRGYEHLSVSRQRLGNRGQLVRLPAAPATWASTIAAAPTTTAVAAPIWSSPSRPARAPTRSTSRATAMSAWAPRTRCSTCTS